MVVPDKNVRNDNNHYIFMRMGQTNLTNNFAAPYLCLYLVYVPAVHICPNELLNIHADTHDTIDRSNSVGPGFRPVSFQPARPDGSGI